MSRKGKKDDAPELEPAANAPDAAGAGPADDAGAAGAGQAATAETGDAAAGDEKPPFAALAGEVPGAADADADAADAVQPETAGEAEGEIEHRHEPAPYDGFAAIIAVEFGETAFTVKLADGQAFLVSHAAVEFLDCASDEAVRDIDIEPHRLVWPGLERVMTVDQLHALARAGYNWHAQGDDSADHFADALAYDRSGIDVGQEIGRDNVLAAFGAASWVHGVDGGWIGSREAVECAAAFLRRDAAQLVQPETLVIHLKRSGFPGTPAAEGRTAVAWKVFAFALAELDALDRAEAEARQRAEAAAQAQGPRPVRRMALAMQRADANPLTEIGRRLQRGD